MLYAYAITAGHPDPLPATLPGEGILPDAPVRLLPAGDLAAAISPVSEAEFGAEGLRSRLEDAEWTRRRVFAHQRVVDSLLGHETVMPLKFCTLFSSEAALRAALVRNQAALDAAANRLRGAREWGLKLYWGGFGDTAPASTAGPTVSAPGAAFFQRKRDARRQREEAEMVLVRCVAESHRRLSEASRAAVANPVQPSAVHGRSGEMVLNAAYLVPRAGEAAWRERLAGLGSDHEYAGISLELTGPWAPYNFTGANLVGS